MPQTAKNDDAKFTIPAGHEPAEFLNDADLAEYHARQLAALDQDDPSRPELERMARAARRAAGLTSAAIADAQAADAVALAATAKK